MANPPKQQGTKRESALVNEFTELGFASQRAPNNSPSWDVDLELGYTTLRLEVKDRQRLSVHKEVDQMLEANGDEHPSILYWHRYVKKPGNTRRTSMGGVYIVPEHVMLTIFRALEDNVPDWWVPA